MGVAQLPVGLPLTGTVHAPKKVWPHPKLVPLRLSSSGSTQSSGMSGGSSTVADFPFNLKVVFIGESEAGRRAGWFSEYALWDLFPAEPIRIVRAGLRAENQNDRGPGTGLV